MTMKLRHIMYLFAALISMAALWACEDDFNPGDGGIVDGSVVTVPVSISFDAETGVDVTSRALGPQAGEAIQNINSFWMVIYREDGSLYKKYHIRENGSNVYEHPGEISNIKYDGDSDNRLPEEGNLGDKAAGRLQFDLQLESKPYYIYGVANVKDFGSKVVDTRDQLKGIECQWDSIKIENNSEMFGVFSIGPKRDADDVNPITVKVKDGKVQQLHCWLRRLASKVTIAFDGSELYDNVEVYIDTIMICDVAKKCYLGLPNHPGQKSAEDPETRLPSDQRYEVENGVYRFGGIEVIQKPTQADTKTMTPQTWYHICNSTHIYGGSGGTAADKPEINEEKHLHTSQALYFYENLQGEGKDKKQSLDGVNIWKPNPKEDDLESGWKDGKAYGTYIEVRGYYRNTAPDGSVSSGWIKYRFMLGQDAEKDYNALRNHHYKVTLKLRGYGNDYDWHIDYKEETGIFITTPQFISYLYNKSMYATVKIVGEMEPGTTLRADILPSQDNNFVEWGPWGDDKANADGEIEFPNPNGKTVDGHSVYYKNNLADLATGPWTSFLSLRKTNVLRIEPEDNSGVQSWQINAGEALKILKKNYEDNNKGWRVYAVNASEVPATDDTDGAYSMQETRKRKNDDGSEVTVERLYRIPLYTRAKELVTKTGFTGNNPYVAYPRKMTVRFTASVRDEVTGAFTPRHFDLDIIQVRRVVNPKGIWREAGSSDEFEVTLMRLPKDDAEKFVDFVSVGKWSAEVVSQSDPVISLSSTEAGSGTTAQANTRRIEGEDECPINFKVNFHGAQSGFAIIRIRYHNYTCEHDIFCMVGDKPVQMDPTKNVWWRPTNVYRFEKDGTAVFAKSPLQEGSLFRRGSLTAITPDNNPVNAVHISSGQDQSLQVLEPGSTAKTAATWKSLKGKKDDALFKKWTIKNANERVADCDMDFYSIADLNGNLNFPIKKAYGVLYGEGASKPAENVEDAYGYDSETGEESAKGMRGVFVYNETNARTIFLPIGKSGHGRRKGIVNWNPTPKDVPGTMRYANRSAYWTFANMTQPIFADLYRRPGAIYWCETLYTDPNIIHKKGADNKFLKDSDGNPVFIVNKSSSFDINYFSMGFEGFSNGSIEARGSADNSESDACFIRTVTTTPPNNSLHTSNLQRSVKAPPPGGGPDGTCCVVHMG